MAVDSGELLKGQKFDERLNILLPFEWQKVPPPLHLGDPSTDIDIVNKDLNLRKVWDVSAIQAALDAYSLNYFTTTDEVRVPDELASIDIIWNEGGADGSFNSEWDGWASGPSWSLSGSESANNHASATALPELSWTKNEYWTHNLPVTRWEFYVPEGKDSAYVLARLNVLAGVTINQWPVFKPRVLSFVLSGGKIAVRVDAQASAGKSYSPDQGDGASEMVNLVEGSGINQDYSPDVRTETLPPMLFSAKDFGANATKTKTVTSQALVSWLGINFPTVHVNPSKSVSVTGTVSPSSFGATSPTEIPKSGLYMVKARSESVGWQRVKIIADVLDCGVFAS